MAIPKAINKILKKLVSGLSLRLLQDIFSKFICYKFIRFSTTSFRRWSCVTTTKLAPISSICFSINLLLSSNYHRPNLRLVRLPKSQKVYSSKLWRYLLFAVHLVIIVWFFMQMFCKAQAFRQMFGEAFCL